MSYDFSETTKVWDQFQKKQIGMKKREEMLAHPRAELYDDQFHSRKRVREQDTSRMMSRAEMLKLAQTEVVDWMSTHRVKRG